MLQVSDYEKELEVMKTMSQEEFVAYVRRYTMKFNNLKIQLFKNINYSLHSSDLLVAGQAVASLEELQCTEE